MTPNTTELPGDEQGTELGCATMELWGRAYELPHLIRKATAKDIATNDQFLREAANMILAQLETKQ